MEETKKCKMRFRCRESNPGRLGENQESLPLDHTGLVNIKICGPLNSILHAANAYTSITELHSHQSKHKARTYIVRYASGPRHEISNDVTF